MDSASVVISGDKQIIYGKLNDGEDKYFETLNVLPEFTDEMNNAIPIIMKKYLNIFL